MSKLRVWLVLATIVGLFSLGSCSESAAPPPPLPAPPVAAEPGPNNELAKIMQGRAALEALPVGKIVLLAPEAMRVGETRQVDANVGIDVSPETLGKQLRPGDQKFEGSARLSSQMVAKLVGAAFAIKPLSPEQQTIAAGFPTVWSWSVEAKDAGLSQSLVATLYALLPERSGNSLQQIDSFTREISVSVREQTWGEWLEALGKEFDIVKTVVVSLVGAATLVAGWFGISFTRRKTKTSGVGNDTPASSKDV